MRFLINNKFKKSVPFEMRDIIERKIIEFTLSISKYISNLNNIPKGFWIKKIHSKNFFEFRVNSGDRIIFDIKDNCIRYIYFSKHDRATEKYDKLKLNKFEELTIETESVITEDNDLNKYNYEEIDFIPELDYIVEDNIDVFKQILENDESKLLHCLYLNNEQVEVLNSNFPIIVTGGAGSGKSAVIFNKMLALEKENKTLKIAYFTLSKSLKNDLKNTMSKINKKSKIEFHDLESYLKKTFNLKKSLADFDIFKLFYSSYKDKINISEEIIYSEINGIIKGMCFQINPDNWNKNNINITLEEYLNLDNTYTILDIEKRKKIFNIFKYYQEYLQKNNSYDMNDICYSFLSNVEEKFDYIFIDEVQDLTEIQILFIKTLLKKEKNLFLAGDIHQLITMNNFKFDRLNSLFLEKINKFYLHLNYRSSKEIVDLSNKLKELRKKYIGSFKLETELPEKSILIGGKVTFIEKEELINSLLQYDANLIIIVATKHSKLELLKLLNLNEFENDIVFTINEIKGLEFKKVICFNLFSDFKDEWETIVNGKAKKNQLYRYFFNILYVSITRSELELYIIEDEKENIFKNLITSSELNSLQTDFSEENEFESKTFILQSSNNVTKSKITKNKNIKLFKKISLQHKEFYKENLEDTVINKIKFFSIKKYEESLIKTLVKIKPPFESLEERRELFIYIILSSSLKAVKFYYDKIESNFKFDEFDKIELNPLLVSVFEGNLEICNFFYELGLYQKYKIPVLNLAIAKNNYEKVEYFIEKGVDVNSTANLGIKKINTLDIDLPLTAILNMHIYNYNSQKNTNISFKIIKKLLEAGAILNTELYKNELCSLILMKDYNTIKELKKYGLTLQSKIDKNISFLDVIVEYNAYEIYKLFL